MVFVTPKLNLNVEIFISSFNERAFNIFDGLMSPDPQAAPLETHIFSRSSFAIKKSDLKSGKDTLKTPGSFFSLCPLIISLG